MIRRNSNINCFQGLTHLTFFFLVTFHTIQEREVYILSRTQVSRKKSSFSQVTSRTSRIVVRAFFAFELSLAMYTYIDMNANARREISECRKSKGRRPVLVSACRGDGEAGGEGRRLRDESGPRDEEHRRWQQSAVSHAADTTHAAHTAHAAHAPHADIGDSASTPAAGLDRLRPRTGEFFIFALSSLSSILPSAFPPPISRAIYVSATTEPNANILHITLFLKNILKLQWNVIEQKCILLLPSRNIGKGYNWDILDGFTMFKRRE